LDRKRLLGDCKSNSPIIKEILGYPTVSVEKYLLENLWRCSLFSVDYKSTAKSSRICDELAKKKKSSSKLGSN
jgi:hypothetical protein